jgi:hypothetical protein
MIIELGRASVHQQIVIRNDVQSGPKLVVGHNCGGFIVVINNRVVTCRDIGKVSVDLNAMVVGISGLSGRPVFPFTPSTNGRATTRRIMASGAINLLTTTSEPLRDRKSSLTTVVPCRRIAPYLDDTAGQPRPAKAIVDSVGSVLETRAPPIHPIAFP